MQFKVQLNGDGDYRALLYNPSLIDERLAFFAVIKRLTSSQGIELLSAQTAPYSDIVEGSCKMGSFSVVFDLDYGLEIKASKKATLQFILSVLHEDDYDAV